MIHLLFAYARVYAKERKQRDFADHALKTTTSVFAWICIYKVPSTVGFISHAMRMRWCYVVMHDVSTVCAYMGGCRDNLGKTRDEIVSACDTTTEFRVRDSTDYPENYPCHIHTICIADYPRSSSRHTVYKLTNYQLLKCSDSDRTDQCHGCGEQHVEW